MLTANKTEQTVLIAGGGIGGMTAALCLAKQGYQVAVFEQTEFTEVGAGLQLSPNCTRVLHDLGLESQLREVAFVPQATQMRDWRTGKLLASNPLGDEIRQRYGFPYYHMHRIDLMKVLLDAAGASTLITLHPHEPIRSVSQAAEKVSLRTTTGCHDGSILVGADGIHSIVRASLFGEDQPRFTGNVAWRGLVDSADLPQDLVRPVAALWWGPGKHFVHYFVRGGALVNCVCVVEKEGWEIESWHTRGDLAELKADFTGWDETIQVLIDNMIPDACFKWALFDRDPMRRWSAGRITLLGDACHPTLPFMAQGAAMAIEDAAVLSRCLATGDSIEASLLRYDSLRRRRTARIQLGSRRNARVFHMSGVQASLRNRVINWGTRRVMDELFRYDALSVE
jgi:salicylate hydroxylase